VAERYSCADFTDSQYVKDNLFRAREWKKNDWKSRYGEPRENSDLCNQLLSAHLKAGITVHFEWTLGKKTPILKCVDKAAKEAAKRGGPDTDRGYKPGAIARSMVGGAANRFRRLAGRGDPSDREPTPRTEQGTT
jgi:hypothetical protein